MFELLNLVSFCDHSRASFSRVISTLWRKYYCGPWACRRQ